MAEEKRHSNVDLWLSGNDLLYRVGSKQKEAGKRKKKKPAWARFLEKNEKKYGHLLGSPNRKTH